jgi:hypothetical protein
MGMMTATCGQQKSGRGLIIPPFDTSSIGRSGAMSYAAAISQRVSAEKS